MSVTKQIAISLVVVLLALAGWYVAGNRDAVFGGQAVANGESPRGNGQSGGGQGGGQGGGSGGGGFSRGGDVPVVTARVGTDTTGAQIRAIGTATAVESITVFPEVTGIVTAIEIEAGTNVAKNQVLFKLDDADQAVEVEKAGVTLDLARDASDRAEKLAKTNNVTEAALIVTRNALRSAEINLKSAELARDKRTIRAPFNGVVGLIPVSVGDLVSSSTALTTLDDVSRLIVNFDAPERFSDLVKIGTPVLGQAVGLPGRDIKGSVSAIDSRVDPATRIFKIEATLEEGIEGLKPGMSITIAVDFPGAPQTTVSSLAVQWDRQGSYVWTIEENKAKRTPVQILGRKSGIVMVAADLQPGEEVVVEGLQRMRDGVAVRRVGGESEPPEAAVSSGDATGQAPASPPAAAPDKAS
jgi:RND family efflux transporter MFP subunit